MQTERQATVSLDALRLLGRKLRTTEKKASHVTPSEEKAKGSDACRPNEVKRNGRSRQGIMLDFVTRTEALHGEAFHSCCPAYAFVAIL